MTDHNRALFTFGGRPVSEILAALLPDLVTDVLKEITARVPAYARLPGEEIYGDITKVTEHALKSFIAMMRTGALPTRQELDYLRESAARRAEEGLPIDVVLTAYHVGVQVVWEALSLRVRPEEVGDAMAVNGLVLRYLELVTPAVGAGYLDQRQAMYDDERSARHTLLSALLTGTDVPAAAGRAGIPLPAAYLVLALAVGAHPDEARPGVDPLVAGRRKLRRLRSELERQVRGAVLSSLTPEGGTILVPTPAVDITAHEWDRLAAVVRAVGRAAGAPVTAGVAAAAPDAVADAAALAADVLEVAVRFAKPAGVYRIDDVLLEFQLSRSSEAVDRLAALLGPLEPGGELMQTLEVFLREGSRRPAARALHVHPNTVDYRLRKVYELTGLDASNVGHAGLLTAALLAHRAAAANP
ncbi:CdaR family transcriptional regulator [Actinokineospora sp. UTMC 2448]|uniref:PucR family transcriptional regulator n=1 Tax=Actinokineospora sp. UTMC 2448 TaxID=2268449 RepID=UPI002164A6C7|nr:PucR family transcriptional regulator [Actinokineospora sp. UTMC 2448]UVS79153.1 Sugar diacid regulator [Actinokineospora sp. UTMC 2448]